MLPVRSGRGVRARRRPACGAWRESLSSPPSVPPPPRASSLEQLTADRASDTPSPMASFCYDDGNVHTENLTSVVVDDGGVQMDLIEKSKDDHVPQEPKRKERRMSAKQASFWREADALGEGRPGGILACAVSPQ